jgi:N-dimethylarginine dimethylaminohydrolase
MIKVVRNVKELSFSKESLATMAVAKNVLMVDPTYFNVDNPINAHMRRKDGSVHHLDKNKAIEQWMHLKKVYQNLGFNVFVCPPEKNLPDMVFCANQSFPFLDRTGKKHAILSNMFHDIRNKEVALINNFLINNNYTTHHFASRPLGYFFESMGDALWLPGYRFILGGHGFRTDARVYQLLSEITQSPVAIFELKNPKFYHLDTCLSILNSTSALACKEAFTEEGWKLLNAIFSNIYEVSLEESDSPGFACNAHCPDEKHVILQKGSSKITKLLQKQGYEPLEVDTSEFIKSGGSVFCMKLMFY